MAAPELMDWTLQPERFFRELPPDWQDEIVPLWPVIAPESHILVFVDKQGFKAGGIVTRTVFPDMDRFQNRALELYAKQYWYVGYLFVTPRLRASGLGTRWLEGVRTAVPAKGFWLVIEKIGLLKFYARSGFRVDRVIHDGHRREWLLVSGREDW